MKRRVQISRFRLLWPLVALLVGLALTMTVMSAMALSASPASPEEAPGWIEGTLYRPNGTTPSGGWIDIHDAAGQPWMGADANPADGSFSIPNLPPGTYILRAYPPSGSPYAASLPVEVEVFSGQGAPATLLLTYVRISGYVRDCDAIPEQRIKGAFVVAHRNDEQVGDMTDANGEFKLGGVDVGVPYTLEALPPHESEYVPLEPITVVPISTSVILEMCIPPINVEGTVRDYTGAPVPGAGVVVFRDEFSKETAADEFGDFHFRGLPLDAGNEFWIQAGPPWGVHGLIASDLFTIAIPTPPLSVTVVLTLPQSFKTVTGEVLNADTSGGVPDAMVTAHRLDEAGYADTRTDSTGAFTLSLTGGEWHLRAEPLPPPAPPAEWIFPGPPAWVVFELSPTDPETKTATLEVIPTNAWVEGRIVCPGGGVCPGDPPHGGIWVELRSDDLRNDAGLGSDYRFAIPIPGGWYELLVHVDHPEVQAEVQGPAPVPVFVGPGQTLDVGEIELLLKDARIMGQVRNEFGVGVEGVRVVGWQPEGFGWGWAETDANGVYTMPVIGGEWLVEPQPGPERPYVFNRRPRFTRVAPGGTMTGVDFVLAWAGARIEGSAVDAHSQERIWGLDGWAWAERADTLQFFSDAPMWDGGFELKAQGAHTYHVGVNLPPHAPYVSGGTGPVEVPPAAHVPVTVPLEHKDAAIEGHLIDALTGWPPAGPDPIWAEVFGEDEQGHWVGVGVDPGSAYYALGVISGTWHLRAWADPASSYVAVPTATVVTVESGQVASPVDFEVWPINALIGGRVLDPDGTGVQAFVFAEGDSPHVGHFETHAESGPDGAFELLVPEGGYVVGAALPGDRLEVLGWLNPRPIDVPWVSAGSPAMGQDLRFRRLDGEIHGTVTFAPGIVATPTHSAYIWGWADTGEWAETEAMTSSINTFTYTLRVVSDTVWHVGAVYEDRDNGVFYESPEEKVPVPPTPPPVAQAFRDLEMGGPWPLPQPFIVSFDGTQMQTIILPGGTELNIPPGALVVSGTVTLFIFPTYEMRPEPGREIIGVGYEMWAVNQNGQDITHFNKNVMMTFSYPSDAVLFLHGISEHLLVPVYYSTLAGHWILADSYVVNTVNNEITLQIDHFTKFSVMSTAPAERRIYLPLVLRSL
jgi:hypothetical protein